LYSLWSTSNLVFFERFRISFITRGTGWIVTIFFLRERVASTRVHQGDESIPTIDGPGTESTSSSTGGGTETLKRDAWAVADEATNVAEEIKSEASAEVRRTGSAVYDDTRDTLACENPVRH
jgi:hypothetical protein